MSYESQKNLLVSVPAGKKTAMVLAEDNERPYTYISSSKFTANPNLKSEGFSKDTVMVFDKIREIESPSSLTPTFQTGGDSLDERLFDARANVKILISKVSMHVSDELRERLFRQIDLLHDPDEWEDGDAPVNLQSFKTFLRWYYLISPDRQPSFGLSAGGNFIASWFVAKDRLVLEFLSEDSIKWFITKHYADEPDRGVGTTKITRIKDVLAAYKAEDWFSGTC